MHEPTPIKGTAAVRYLVDGGLLSDRQAQQAHTVEESSLRNQSTHVACADGSGFVLKQRLAGLAKSDIANEAGWLEHLWNVDPDGAAHWLPRFIHYDAAEDLIVTELFPGSRDVRAYHEAVGRTPAWIGSRIGQSLAWLHRLAIPSRPGHPLGDPAPWVLWKHRPEVSDLRRASAAELRLIRVIQAAPDLPEALDVMCSRWVQGAIVHCDIRFSNIIARPRNHGPSRLQLVDWELTRAGDPAWDVGASLAAYLESWILSMPVAPETPIEESSPATRHPLAEVQPAIRALWDAYTDGGQLTGEGGEDFLTRAIGYIAANLVRTGYELSSISDELPAHVVLLVQAAVNIIQRRHDAVVHLLGLPPIGWAR